MKDLNDVTEKELLINKFQKRISYYESEIKNNSSNILGNKYISYYKYLDTENLIKTTKISSKTIEIANGIVDNKFFFLSSLEKINFGEKINWNYQHNNAANTYQLYIQTLNVISYLCDAYVESREEVYLYKAYDLLLDWIHFIKTDEELNKFKWVDHTVANRTLTMIYFINLAKDIINIDLDIIIEILIEHGEFLYDDKNYTKNNHGIMSDRSLLALTVFLENYPEKEKWFEKGKFRIREAFSRDFSYQGVHLENSPSYHNMVKTMFERIQNFLTSFNLTLGEDISEKLKMTDNYLRYIVKPNGYLPTIGDTSSSKFSVKKAISSFHDTEAGITIMQSNKTTWLSFICGYGSRTHKHRDDLSLNLFYKGKDILVDSGHYNYDLKDKFRKYIISPQAHSTIIQKNKTYKIKPPLENKEKIKTINYSSNDIYDYVKGIHHGYDGFLMERSIIFFKPDIIFIFDNIISEEIKIFQQNFNLAPHLKVLELNKSKTVCSSNGENVIFKQIIQPGQVQKFTGDRETPRAVISERFGKLIDNTQLVFSTKGNNVQFLTGILLGDGERKLEDISFNQNTRILNINIEGQKFSLVI